MTGKHTPGPWAVDPEDLVGDGKKVADAQGRAICWTSACRNIRGRVLNNPIEAEEAVANARLIAAAPELLEALEDIVDYRGGADSALDDEYVMDRVMSAIAKARGEV